MRFCARTRRISAAWSFCSSARAGTGSGEKTGYYENFPCLTAEAARFVASLPAQGRRRDSISLDPCDSADFPNHMALLGADFVNTENLTGIDALIGKRFTFLTMPLKFENADGCSCRAAAITTEEAE